MKPKFKNPLLKKDYELTIKSAKMALQEKLTFWDRNHFTEERKVLDILLGYLDSLLELAEELQPQCDRDSSLDLTYKTVKNLPLVLGYQYMAYTRSHSFSKEEALDISKRTLASYLILLCMNEHMCIPQIERIVSVEEYMDGDDWGDTWCGNSLKIGTEHKLDLLQEVGYSILVTFSGRFMVRISHISDLYKSICGIDLREHGFDDFACELVEDTYFNIIENDSI